MLIKVVIVNRQMLFMPANDVSTVLTSVLIAKCKSGRTIIYLISAASR